MVEVDFYHAQDQFMEIIEQVLRGEEVVIEKDNQPLVKLTSLREHKKERVFGSARGLIQIADDFDEPLDDFTDYM